MGRACGRLRSQGERFPALGDGTGRRVEVACGERGEVRRREPKRALKLTSVRCAESEANRGRRIVRVTSPVGGAVRMKRLSRVTVLSAGASTTGRPCGLGQRAVSRRDDRAVSVERGRRLSSEGLVEAFEAQDERRQSESDGKRREHASRDGRADLQLSD